MFTFIKKNLQIWMRLSTFANEKERNLIDINQEFHGQLWKVSSWDKAQFWNIDKDYGIFSDYTEQGNSSNEHGL